MTTLVAGIRGDGVVAPFALTGSMDGLTFESYVEQILVPCLRPGDIVVLDRLQAHRGRAVGRAIRKTGAGCGICHLTRRTTTPLRTSGPR